MNGQRRNWDDLTPRVLTAIGLSVVGIGAIWVGDVLLLTLAAIIVGLMIWELTRMLAPQQANVRAGLAFLGAACVFGFFQIGALGSWVLLAATPILGVLILPRDKAVFAAYAVAIVVTGVGFVTLRNEHGLVWILWLVCVVVISDVAGYFVGKYLGGPKFWPRISPKKTWSGTIAGWVGAGGVGFLFVGATHSSSALIVISATVALAAQMGDIWESAIKRHAGVKDSSNLLPGHGGLLDRFDGVIGATLLVFLLSQLFGFPSGIE